MQRCRECDAVVLRDPETCRECSARRPGLRLGAAPSGARTLALEAGAVAVTAVPALLAVDAVCRWLLVRT